MDMLEWFETIGAGAGILALMFVLFHSAIRHQP